jgi:hypothetical protein
LQQKAAAHKSNFSSKKGWKTNNNNPSWREPTQSRFQTPATHKTLRVVVGDDVPFRHPQQQQQPEDDPVRQDFRHLQSPVSFSSSSAAAKPDGFRTTGESFGPGGDLDHSRSLVSVESSDAGSMSTTNSVNEVFVEQVERLDQLLATPSQQLGDLAYTPHKESIYTSDDDLDCEMGDLETSQRLLAEELSPVDFSLPGVAKTTTMAPETEPQPDTTTTVGCPSWRPMIASLPTFLRSFSSKSRRGLSQLLRLPSKLPLLTTASHRHRRVAEAEAAAPSLFSLPSTAVASAAPPTPAATTSRRQQQSHQYEQEQQKQQHTQSTTVSFPSLLNSNHISSADGADADDNYNHISSDDTTTATTTSLIETT